MADNAQKVTEVLVRAREAVDAAGLPEKLQAVAFAKAVDLLTGTTPAPIQPAAPAGQGTPPAAGDAKTLAAVAAKLKVSEETVGEVFHVDGDDLGLGVPARKLEVSDSGATRQLALLVAAGRQAGKWDAEWTEGNTIRAVVSDYGKYDSANFAYTVKSMDEVFSITGKGQGWMVKVNRKGYEEAAALVTKLTGGDSK